MTQTTITRAELARMIDHTLLDPEATAAMTAAVGGRLGIKAAGGIRTTGDALAMIAAGATRIGASHTAAILDGLPR